MVCKEPVNTNLTIMPEKIDEEACYKMGNLWNIVATN